MKYHFSILEQKVLTGKPSGETISISPVSSAYITKPKKSSPEKLEKRLIQARRTRLATSLANRNKRKGKPRGPTKAKLAVDKKIATITPEVFKLLRKVLAESS